MQTLTEAEATDARELRSGTGTAAGLDSQPGTIDMFVLGLLVTYCTNLVSMKSS